MRIAIISPFYPYPPSIGGTETIVRQESQGLAEKGHEVSVITTPYDVTSVKQVSPYGIEERDEVTVYNLKPSSIRIGYARILKGLKKTLDKIGPDIVHSHNLHPHLFRAMMWKKEFGYKLVAQLHHPSVELDHLSARLLFPFVEKFLVGLQQSIDAVLAHTNLEKDWLTEIGISPKKIKKLTFPSIPSELLSYNPKPVCQHNFPEKQVLLFMGRITERKGIHVLIQAMPQVISEIGDALLIVAGPREERYHRLLKRKISELGLTKTILLKKPLTEEEKYNYIGSCHIFVLPSIKDLHPITLLEAQALGTPVVATRVGAIEEIVKDRETGMLVKPNDPEELTEAVVKLIRDGRTRNKMTANAKKHAKKFRSEKTMRELEKVYQDLLRIS